MAKKRINELTEATSVKTDHYIPVDHGTDGTQKMSMATLIDSTLAVSGKAADAKAVGNEFANVRQDLGDLDDLQTTVKSDLVSAINEAMQSGGGLDLEDLTMSAVPASVEGYSTLTLSDNQGTSKSVNIPVNTLSDQDTDYIDSLVQQYLETLVVDGDEGEY